MLEIVENIVLSGHAEELRAIIEQYELDVSKSQEKEKTDRT